MNTKEIKFMQATKADAPEILQLYHSLLGTEYCVWSEQYPGQSEIDFDLSREALFCCRKDGKIVGAISIDLDEAVCALPCWSSHLQPSVEISRLGVHADYQNQGIALWMLRQLMQICKERGMKSIHFLVAKSNVKALRSYEKLHADVVGEGQLFGHEYWCYEKNLE